MIIIRFFHRFRFLRQLAKFFAQRIDIKQKFYNGYIYLNAVDHAWAWTASNRYDTFDRHLQNFIHEKSKSFQYFIDIGSNIGVMTLGTLLKNPNIHAVAVDPNSSAISLLEKSLRCNGLSKRCRVISAAVGREEGVMEFDLTGSVTGHVVRNGTEVNTIHFVKLLNEFSEHKTLVKIDIEGFEAIILKDLKMVKNLENFSFILELHPLGFNDHGNPLQVINGLKELNGIIKDLNNITIECIDENDISQILVCFN